jgi:hypothetical protein
LWIHGKRTPFFYIHPSDVLISNSACHTVL